MREFHRKQIAVIEEVVRKRTTPLVPHLSEADIGAFAREVWCALRALREANLDRTGHPVLKSTYGGSSGHSTNKRSASKRGARL